MLVLTRKKNESIMIADNIEIKIIAIDGDTVRIGIAAPRDVDVHRKEVYLGIKEENKLASQAKLDLNALKQFTIKAEKKPSEE